MRQSRLGNFLEEDDTNFCKLRIREEIAPVHSTKNVSPTPMFQETTVRSGSNFLPTSDTWQLGLEASMEFQDSADRANWCPHLEAGEVGGLLPRL
jgi:hypothetical protein